MRNPAVAIALTAALLGSACSTMPPGDMVAHSALPGSSAEQPWQRAQAEVTATESDMARSGIRGIGPHVAKLEEAMAQANHPFGDSLAENGDRLVLADGQTETFGAALIGAGRDGRQTVVLVNPYPRISFYLGSYYNEIAKPTEALRVLDAGLSLPEPIPGSMLGEMRPHLIGEKGVALISLKRWPEALATYESGLTLKSLDSMVKGLLLRGRGFALTELGRLDEAEAAYAESLVAEPNNPRALNELAYIARLRRGGAPTAPVVGKYLPPPVP